MRRLRLAQQDGDVQKYIVVIKLVNYADRRRWVDVSPHRGLRIPGPIVDANILTSLSPDAANSLDTPDVVLAISEALELTPNGVRAVLPP